MATYFAQDGNYGYAFDMVILNTDKWTDEDWLLIEQASDFERVRVAEEIDNKYNKEV